MYENSKKILQVNENYKINGIISTEYDAVLKEKNIHYIVPYSFFKNTVSDKNKV